MGRWKWNRENTMRIFSEIEKQYIRELVNGSRTCPTLLASHNITEFNQLLDFKNHKLIIPIESYPKNNWAEPLFPIIEKTTLVEYLAEKGYIILLENKNKTTQYGQKPFHPIELPIPEPAIPIIERVINSSIIVKPELKMLVDNNFKEYEELVLDEAKKQTTKATKSVRWAIAAVIVSVLTLLFTILYNIVIV